MATLTAQPADQRVVLANAQTVLPFPPVAASTGATPGWWTESRSIVGEAELEITAAADVDLTEAELLVATPQPIAIADVVATGVDAGTNAFTKNAHGLVTGDGPLMVQNAGGALPGGIAADTAYYAIATGANTFQLATSRANALAGTFVDLTSNGTGTQTVVDVPGSTARLFWLSAELLGHAGDGAVALTARKGYRRRFQSSARAAAFAVAATLSAPVAVTVAVWPLV